MMNVSHHLHATNYLGEIFVRINEAGLGWPEACVSVSFPPRAEYFHVYILLVEWDLVGEIMEGNNWTKRVSISHRPRVGFLQQLRDRHDTVSPPLELRYDLP